jgi:hypothetical protein
MSTYRNDRGIGNIGIIRSPIRVSILPDWNGPRRTGFRA